MKLLSAKIMHDQAIANDPTHTLPGLRIQRVAWIAEDAGREPSEAFGTVAQSAFLDAPRSEGIVDGVEI